MSARRNASVWRGVGAVGASLVLVVRRAGKALGPLLGIIALTAIMAGIAVAAPSEIDATRDRAAREAIASAGHEADLALRSAIADRAAANTTTAERLLAFASEVAERLPSELSAALSEVRTGILGPELRAAGPLGDLRLHVGVLDPAARTELILDEGRLPNGGASDLELVVSAATAEATGLTIGDTVDVRGGVASDGFPAQIVGIGRALDASALAWVDLPGVWEPRELTSRGTVVGVTFTALSDVAAFDRVSSEFPGASVGIVRTAFDPTKFSMHRLDEVQAAIDDIETAPYTITQGAPLSLSATSGIEKALKSFTVAVTAATAQLSALAAGLLGVAVLITVLAGTALARRRQREIDLLRSRGATLGLIGAHAAIESVLVTLIGSGLGVAAATLLGYRLGTVTLLVAAMALVAVTPVVVTLAWAREAAPSTTRARAVRIAGVAILVVVAVMAVIAQRTGVSVGSASIDPLALAAPILCAAIVALTLSPLSGAAVRPISRIASRTRGAGTLLAASSARDGRSVVTLFALTLAVSVAITSLILLSTVTTGQESTSWRAVGADVRVDNATDAVALSHAFASDGAAAASFAELGGVKVEGDADSSIATVLAVDGDYAELLAALPAGQAQRGDADAVRQLVSAGGDAGGPVPVLFNARLAATVDAETISLDIDGTTVDVTVVGAPIAGPAVSGSALIVDRERLLAHLDTLRPAVGEETLSALSPTTVLAVGASASADSAAISDGDVTARADVLTQLRDGALVSGVRAATMQSLIGTGALALLALIVTTVLGARRRGRNLALLGALGVPKRASFAIASGELVPLVVSGIVGGGVAAAVAIGAAGSAFGVDTLAGGPAPFIISPWLIAAVVGAAAVALVIAIAIDTPLSRRVGTAEILRTGEES